jgi:hypothetical protein
VNIIPKYNVLISGNHCGAVGRDFDFVLRAVGYLVVNKVHLIDHVLAHEGRAHVVIGVGVSCRASFLHPEESVLHTVNPGRVLGGAFVSIGGRWNLDTELIPVGTATASWLGTLRVAGAHSDASIEVPVSQTILRGWETLLAIKRISIAWNDSTYLIS